MSGVDMASEPLRKFDERGNFTPEYSSKVAALQHYDQQRPSWDPYVWGVFQWACMPFWSVALFLYLWHGGRPVGWMRKSFIFRWFINYFPVTLHKTADLDPSQKYVLGYHPHGLFGLGCVGALGSDACNFSQKFPNIKSRVLTLATNFQVPFYRDYLMAAGFCSVSRRSCENILRKGPGHAIVIVIGGAQESLAAHPGHMDLTLRRRFGFVKVALHTGAHLVPVIGFGENEVMSQVDNHPGSFLYWFQQQFKKVFGFTMPIFYGRGFLHRRCGWVPYRRPIDVVVGKPIPVTQTPNPSPQQVEELHDVYVKSLQALWEEHKDKYAPLRLHELRLVD